MNFILLPIAYDYKFEVYHLDRVKYFMINCHHLNFEPNLVSYGEKEVFTIIQIILIRLERVLLLNQYHS